jgi:hypothetical protein
VLEVVAKKRVGVERRFGTNVSRLDGYGKGYLGRRGSKVVCSSRVRSGSGVRSERGRLL